MACAMRSSVALPEWGQSESRGWVACMPQVASAKPHAGPFSTFRYRARMSEPKPVRFTATLRRPAQPKNATWRFLRVPPAASKQLPSRGMVSVTGTLGGHAFKATLEPDGEGSHWLKVPRALHEGAAAEAGKTVVLELLPVDKDRNRSCRLASSWRWRHRPRPRGNGRRSRQRRGATSSSGLPPPSRTRPANAVSAPAATCWKRARSGSAASIVPACTAAATSARRRKWGQSEFRAQPDRQASTSISKEWVRRIGWASILQGNGGHQGAYQARLPAPCPSSRAA